MAVSRLTQTSLQNAFQKYNTVWDGVTAVGSIDALATVTIGSSGAASVTFSSIPQTYTHLYLSIFAQTNRATYNIDGLRLRFNNDSTSVYSYHSLGADPVTGGTTASASGGSSQTNILLGQVGTTVAASVYGGSLIDILDYTNPNKYKVLRAVSGVDTNGGAGGYSGYNGLYSGSWQSSNAITSIYIYSDTSSMIQQYSTFSLYGVK